MNESVVLLFAERLLFATVCSFIIGFERKSRSKEAGIKTHCIVGLASALIMIISKYGFTDVGVADGSRIAAQIVSGVGFLGAGMIFVRHDSVSGLTTAAGIWATAGVGMAIGAGMYWLGGVTSVLILTIHFVTHFIERSRSDHYRIEMKTDQLDEIMKMSEKSKIQSLSIERHSGKVVLDISIVFPNEKAQNEWIANLIKLENVIRLDY